MLNFYIKNNQKEDWIILFHGIGGDANTWNLQEKCLSEKYNLLLLDLPAHGKSGYNYDKITIDGLNKEIAEVLRYNKISKAIFIGLSLGSIVMGNFIMKHPQYVKSVIFVASVIEMNLFCKTVIHVGYIFRKILPYKPLYKIAIKMVAPQKKYKSERKMFEKGFDKMGRQNLMLWLEYVHETIKRTDIQILLNKIKKPILFISGGKDRYFLSGSIKTANSVNGAELAMLKNSMHVCNRDEYDAFNRIIIGFLDKNAVMKYN